MKKPVHLILNIDTRKLPSIIFDPIQLKGEKLEKRDQQQEDSWESFGKPGRDPNTLNSVLELFSHNNHWDKFLLIANINSLWPKIVGEYNSQFSKVEDIDNKTLIVSACNQSAYTITKFLINSSKNMILDKIKENNIKNIKDIKLIISTDKSY
ncbi:DciA family protein [Gardnerella sp. KA00255]|uniref:DciA family protein n=1 Tax=Gardnerella sp. KA00255 TaxID=2749073 RepID=UPI003BA9C87D